MSYKAKATEWGIPIIAASFILALGLFTSGCGGGGGSGDASPATTSSVMVWDEGAWDESAWN